MKVPAVQGCLQEPGPVHQHLSAGRFRAGGGAGVPEPKDLVAFCFEITSYSLGVVIISYIEVHKLLLRVYWCKWEGVHQHINGHVCGAAPTADGSAQGQATGSLHQPSPPPPAA